LSTPDMDRRDTSALPDRTKKESSGFVAVLYTLSFIAALLVEKFLCECLYIAYMLFGHAKGN
jgi:hypothetical protein